MSQISFPLRVEKGFLRRTDEATAALAILGIMARTPHGSWAGNPHFGLREFMSGPKARQQNPQVFVDEINRALRDLGITEFQVATVVRRSDGSAGDDEYDLTVTAGAASYNVSVQLDSR